jgi:hypothetical protein
MLTQSERINICSTCLNRKFNRDTGLVCGLTLAKPNFENTCSDYQADEEYIIGKLRRKLFNKKTIIVV